MLLFRLDYFECNSSDLCALERTRPGCSPRKSANVAAGAAGQQAVEYGTYHNRLNVGYR